VTISRSDGGVILSFSYSDLPPWPVVADVDGYSLTLINPFNFPDHSDPRSWRASVGVGGSPDGDDSIDYAGWKAANGGHADDEDLDGDGLTTRVEYFLGGEPNTAEPGLVPGTVLQADGSVVMSIDRVAGSVGVVGPEASTDLEMWSMPGGTEFLSASRLPGIPARDRLVFRIPAPVPAGRLFVRFAFGP
jgi:hypothetical protein